MMVKTIAVTDQMKAKNMLVPDQHSGVQLANGNVPIYQSAVLTSPVCAMVNLIVLTELMKVKVAILANVRVNLDCVPMIAKIHHW